MSKSTQVIQYFKNTPSSLYSSGIPLANSNSHLYNFDNCYKKSTNDFWVKIEELTKALLTLDTKNCPRYIFLCGFPGSGKTHFAVGLYRAMVQKLGVSSGGGAFFANFSDISKEIIGGFHENIPMRVALDGFLKDKWLFLDDLTSSERIFKPDSLEFQLLRDIVINRWDTGKTLITSSNLEAEYLLGNFSGIFGEYLMSRLSDNSIVQFPDQDRRIK